MSHSSFVQKALYVWKAITRGVFLSIIFLTLLFPTFSFAGNFDIALGDGADTSTLGQGINLLDRLESRSITGGGESLRDFLVDIGTNVLIPILIFAGIVFALIGFFRLMLSDSEDEMKKASKFILRGVVGVMLMVGAGYIVDQLVGANDPGQGAIITLLTGGEASGGEIAAAIYEKLFFPFLRMVIFIILGVLFIYAVITAFKYMFSTDEDTQKKNIISVIYAAAGILVIILAKSIVEAVYGTYGEVTDGASNLGEIGTGVFENPNYSTLFTIINRVLGLVTFIIVIILIYQGYLLLTNPNNEENMEKLKKNFGYIFIGIFLIGTAYLLVNFFIVQK